MKPDVDFENHVSDWHGGCHYSPKLSDIHRVTSGLAEIQRRPKSQGNQNFQTTCRPLSRLDLLPHLDTRASRLALQINLSFTDTAISSSYRSEIVRLHFCNSLGLLPLTPNKRLEIRPIMTEGGKPAVSFDAIIKEGELDQFKLCCSGRGCLTRAPSPARRKKRAEKLAQQILGKGRTPTPPAVFKNHGDTLASRMGVNKVGVGLQSACERC